MHECRGPEVPVRQHLALDLDGNEIMELLQVPPGPVIGAAYRFLLDLRMDRGPMSKELAAEALRAWWAARKD